MGQRTSTTNNANSSNLEKTPATIVYEFRPEKVGGSVLLHLPLDIWKYIAKEFCSLNDKKQLRLVCHWFRIKVLCAPIWLSNVPLHLVEENLLNLKRLGWDTSAYRVFFSMDSHPKNSFYDLPKISSLPSNLQVLDLSNLYLSVDFVFFRNLPTSLTCLHVPTLCSFPIKKLKTMTTLKELSILCTRGHFNRMTVGDDDIKILPTSLTKLKFTQMDFVTDKGLQFLPSSLVSLDLTRTIKSLEALSKLPKGLTELIIGTLHNLKNLEQLPAGLRKLTISSSSISTTHFPPSLTCVEFKYCSTNEPRLLEKLPATVTKLNLERSKGFWDGSLSLPFASSLQELNLNLMALTASDFINLPPHVLLLCDLYNQPITPLQALALQGDYTSLREYHLRTNVDLNQKNLFGETALSLCAQKGKGPIVQYLMENSCNVNQTSLRNESILHKVFFRPIIEMLLKAGINVNVRRHPDGFTPLHVHCENGSSDIVKCLLEYGADVDAEANEIGNFVTPLFLGIEKKYLPVIQYLLDHKADVNKRQTGKNGWTPLLYATLLEDKGVIELLVKNGADCNQVCLISDTCELLNNKEKVQPVGEVCEVTPTYVAWWRNSECLATLEKRSQSTLNLSLAKKNKHKQALQYFSVQE